MKRSSSSPGSEKGKVQDRSRSYRYGLSPDRRLGDAQEDTSEFVFCSALFSPPAPACPAKSFASVKDYETEQAEVTQDTTPVGLEPTRGDPIGLAGRHLSRSAKVSSAIMVIGLKNAKRRYHRPLSPHPRSGSHKNFVRTQKSFSKLWSEADMSGQK